MARHLHAGVALPLFTSAPLARRGPSGRPTVVSNAETAAQVAIIAAPGAAVAGGRVRLVPGAPTLDPDRSVRHPGDRGRTPRASHDRRDPGLGRGRRRPQAVLMGGYAGTWIPGDVVPGTRRWSRAACAPSGRPGAAVSSACCPTVPAGSQRRPASCRTWPPNPPGSAVPVCTGSRFSRRAACVGERHRCRRALRRIRRTAEVLPGSGACSHPDGVVRLVASTLDVFQDDVVRHRKAAPCRQRIHRTVVPTRRSRCAVRTVVVRVDPTRCRGHGICALMFPDGVELDRWGYGRPLDEVRSEGRRTLAQARRAQRACPNGAISFTVEEHEGISA